MLVREQYRLELHWEDVVKYKDDRCELINAYFCGPVLTNMKELKSGDNITLDFTPQYSRIITDYYFVNFSWGEVFQRAEKITLKKAVLSNTQVNDISDLSKNDYIVIDTEKHEEEIHLYNLVYRSYVVSEGGNKHE